MFNHTYERMKHKLKSKLHPYDHDIFGFNNQPVKAWGVITLPLELDEKGRYATHEIDFLVVDWWSLYNAILGRAQMLVFKMVVSQPYLKAKFPIINGVGV